MNYNPNKLCILLYHGVTNLKSKGIENYSGKHIDEKLFYKQMKILKKKYKVISMDELLYYKKNDLKLPKRTVCITFDDGFENNYTIAAPILDDLNLPATFYFSTGLISSKKMFWVDQIEDCINNTKKKNIEFNFVDFRYVFQLISRKNKIEALEKIKKFCKSNNAIFKDKMINHLKKITDIKPSIYNSKNYKKIKWPQVKKLSDNKLFIIGGHSMEHDILSQLSVIKMKKDIKDSIQILSKNLKTKIIHYSYPEGQHEHFNNEIIKNLKKNFIECCPSAIFGQDYLEQDLFRLKRIVVGMRNTKKLNNFFN